MTPDVPQRETIFDAKLLSDVIYELNIARRCGVSYPEGHPRIQASAKKVMALLRQLLEFRERLPLGIAGDVILVDQFQLDKKNPVYRDYAKHLFQSGIATLTIHRDLTDEEFLQFNRILGLHREKLKEQGGVLALLQSSGMKHIEVQGIDYGLFQVREEKAVSPEAPSLSSEKKGGLWERFVLGLLENSLERPDPSALLAEEADPAALAQIVNRRSAEGNEKQLHYDRVIASYIQQLFEKEASAGRRKKHLDQLSQFILHLNPALRRLFLTDTFRTLALRKDLPLESLPTFSEDLILEAFERINAQSPYYLLILGLLQKLSSHLDSGIPSPLLKGRIREKEEAVSEKLQTLFRDFDLDAVMEKSYQTTLQTIVSAEAAPPFEAADREQLKATLENHMVDVQVSSIILEILYSGFASENIAGLERNLRDLCAYFLQLGDFQALIRLCTHRAEVSLPATDPSSAPQGVFKFLSEPDFMEEILNGVEIWGKEKFAEIKTLIRHIGKPIVPALLDRLADEASLTIRRFFLEILGEVGGSARDLLLSRLNDKRWYFVRNLIVVLRALGDASFLPAVRNLCHHAHPRVREEALKTLLHFRDPEAEGRLLMSLGSLDPEVRRSAIQMAELSRGTQVYQRLLELLQHGPWNAAELDTKLLIVRCLAKMGNPAAFPGLEKVLRMKSLFRGQLLTRLKGEVIKSLELYPPAESRAFLEGLGRNLNGPLNPLISQTLGKIGQRSLP